MSAPLPYAPYQSHRRAPSTASNGSGNNSGTSTPQTATGSTLTTAAAAQGNSRPSPLRSNDSAPRATGALGKERAGVGPAAPPPLRTISSLRAKERGTAEPRGASAGPSSSSSSSAATAAVARRAVSSTLAVPTASTSASGASASASASASSSSPSSHSSTSSPSLTTAPLAAGSRDHDLLSPHSHQASNHASASKSRGNHAKRHSYSNSPARANQWAGSHSRSISSASGSGGGSSSNSSNNNSNLLLAPHLPQQVSTAQRLRDSSNLSIQVSGGGRDTPTSASPISPSPSVTPGRFSPNMDAIGHNAPLPDLSYLTLTQAEVDGNRLVNGGLTGRGTAYRPGFQPKGVYRVRTDDFAIAKARSRDSASHSRRRETRSEIGESDMEEAKGGRSEMEAQRLERRLEKLLLLHGDANLARLAEAASYAVDSSSAISWLPETLKRQRRLAEEEKQMREDEMRVVKWEDDASRKACAICQTAFSLTVRKHHCRLCGRLVCASPQLSVPPLPFAFEEKEQPLDAAQLAELKCSGLVIGDANGGTKIRDLPPRWEERPLFDVFAAPSGGDSVRLKSGPSISNLQRREEVESMKRRGIRACKDCRSTIMHRQYMLDDGSLPPYLRLYDELVSLQKDIEQSLPEFQEMVLGLQRQDAAAALGTNGTSEQSQTDDYKSGDVRSIASDKARHRTALALQRDAAQARKQLLLNFANYDALAKRIRALPVLASSTSGNGGGATSGQKRVQEAIWTRANLFLQQNMFPLQSLPKLGAKSSNGVQVNNQNKQGITPSSLSKAINGSTGAGPDEETLRRVQQDPEGAKEQLVVLEQQLTLVKQYATSAQKSRKFQDAKTLRASVDDLQREIERLRAAGVSA